MRIRISSLIALSFSAGFALAFILFGVPSQPQAQVSPGTGVTVQGPITVNNCVKWIANGIIGDAGTTC